jgi:type I restriction enzyme, R subunit
MSNFDQIPAEWQPLTTFARQAEQVAMHDPVYAAFQCRKCLEVWVHWMYKHDGDLVLPYDTSLSALMHEPDFKRIIAPSFLQPLNAIRKLGNDAAHSCKKIKPEEAVHVLQLLHRFMYWAVNLYGTERVPTPAWVSEHLGKADKQELKKTRDELQQLEQQYLDARLQLVKAQAELSQLYAEQKQANAAAIPPPTDPNEALTRSLYVDMLLAEAGWDSSAPKATEYEVAGMPRTDGTTGNGYVDYVLWGRDGRPLAVVEAKRTRLEPRKGKQQAKLYADCLEQQFGRRPLIYYSNGYETYLWDDAGQYPDRRVYGFMTIDELERMMARRERPTRLAEQAINTQIVGRPYQHTGIRAVCEAFDARERGVLMVMATGTGKTRVSAALVDLLSKAGWAKRILFLADRTALTFQAQKVFHQLLPHLDATDVGDTEAAETARVVFSTYQSMINRIDGEWDGRNRMFGVGHFDVVIFDEIHRSVYQKYRAIFHYFDGLRIGLTATPSSHADRDTYGLFGLNTGNPTFAYELDKAVAEGYLVPPKGLAMPIKFPREGIKYDDLSDREKQEYEEELTDPLGNLQDEVEAGALNKWLFNKNTVDKVIEQLMQYGIKVEGGDKLAKTIVFARSHKHAVFFEERFNMQYPALAGQFCRVIDNYEQYSHDLLEQFKIANAMPQIAISVDMLDTGIDVPELCNLVFFKPVKSYTKYWQMIGRGTRLCQDLFGPGEHKTEFLILDFCDNFAFFDSNPAGFHAPAAKSLSQRLFEVRIRLAYALLQTDDDTYIAYAHELLRYAHARVVALEENNFIVRQQWSHVHKYKQSEAWQGIDDLMIGELVRHISALVSEPDDDEAAKRFDALMYDLQIFTVQGDTQAAAKAINFVQTASDTLRTKKASLPAVKNALPTLRAVQDDDFWAETGVIGLEKLREELRDLMKYLDRVVRPPVYTDFEDTILSVNEAQLVGKSSLDLVAYRRRFEQYLAENQHHLTIYKLRTNVALTPPEVTELERLLFEQSTFGSRQEYEAAYGKVSLGRFVRSVLGLDLEATRSVFGEYLDANRFNTQQIAFIELIIRHFAKGGALDTEKLFESPFTDQHTNGVFGVFGDHAARVVELVEYVNRTGEVG